MKELPESESLVPEVLPPRGNSTTLALRNEETIKAMALRFAQVNPITGDASEDLTRQMAQMALAYGLDPALGHIEIYEGKPYPTIDAMVAWADQNPAYDGYEHRQLSRAEAQDMGYRADTIVVEVLVHRKDRRYPTKEYGTANPNNPYRNNPTEEQFPAEMARKRGLYRAIRFGLPMNMQARAGMELDPDRDLMAQHRQLVADSTPKTPDVPRGMEWRQFWARVRQEGLTNDEVHETVRVKGFDIDYIDPETGDIRPSMLAFEGTPHDALVLLGIEKARALRGEIRPDDEAPAHDTRVKREAIAQQNAANAEAAAKTPDPTPAPASEEDTAIRIWTDELQSCQTAQEVLDVSKAFNEHVTGASPVRDAVGPLFGRRINEIKARGAGDA